jgi:hypothetical protein
MQEKEEIVIDFSRIDESFMAAYGARMRMLLNILFTGEYFPVSVRGSRSQVDSFTRALAGEKRYMSSLTQYGLNNPKTMKDKFKLNRAVKGFERDTGLIWPFK